MIGSIQETLCFSAKVQSVKENLSKKWIGGFGETARFDEVSKGWFVCLEGSHEAIYAGPSKPNIQVGDLANVSISFSR